ncbi:hypothetical protein [Paenibacillus sp. DYY-L-2]|uniref:hypothetical protein n=1 Tax=Paenibacillus sp. DYY-L-2 TaxID=3447013 RepID=UPI003F4F805D
MVRHRKFAMVAMAAVLSLSLAACGGNNGKMTNPVPSENNSGTAGTNQPGPGTVSETKQGKGIWVGLADNHSAEIEMDGTPQPFQLDEAVKTAAEALNSGDPVEFEYVEAAIDGEDSLTQKTITKLMKSGNSEDNASSPNGNAEEALPATRSIEIELEGMKEERTAKLAEGKGYALYAFEGFTFDPETNKLQMDYDNNYNVEIAKLPSDYKTEQLSEEAKKELADTGKVEEMKGEEIHASMRDASLFLIARGEKVTREYIVKEVDGQGYLFKLNMPHGEASEGFGPLAYASINTLVNR